MTYRIDGLRGLRLAAITGGALGVGLLAASFALGSGPAKAQEEIGSVAAATQVLEGEAENITRRRLEIGASVVENERIFTSAEGGGQILFKDQTSLTLAPNSEITLNRFVFDPSSGQGDLGVSLASGALRFIGGALSDDEEVEVETPFATIGIRGGMGLIFIDPDNGLRFIFLAGARGRMTAGGETLYLSRAGAMGQVGGRGEPPRFVRLVDAEMLDALFSAFELSGGGGSEESPTNDAVGESGIQRVGSEEPGAPFRRSVSTSGGERFDDLEWLFEILNDEAQRDAPQAEAPPTVVVVTPPEEIRKPFFRPRPYARRSVRFILRHHHWRPWHVGPGHRRPWRPGHGGGEGGGGEGGWGDAGWEESGWRESRRGRREGWEGGGPREGRWRPRPEVDRFPLAVTKRVGHRRLEVLRGGFYGGVVQRRGPEGSILTQTTTADRAGDVEIVFDPRAKTVRIELNDALPPRPRPRRGEGEGPRLARGGEGGEGRPRPQPRDIVVGGREGPSAFKDDATFAAASIGRDGAAVAGSSAVTRPPAKIFPETVTYQVGPDRTNVEMPVETEHEYLRWGNWAAVSTDRRGEGPAEIAERARGSFVAGDVAHPRELPTEGKAYHRGHAFVTIARDGRVYEDGGGYHLEFDFAERRGQAQFRDLAGYDIDVDVSARAGKNAFSGDFANVSPIQEATGLPTVSGGIDGAFFRGGANPAAASGGAINFASDDARNDLQAGGVFAGESYRE